MSMIYLLNFFLAIGLLGGAGCTKVAGDESTFVKVKPPAPSNEKYIIVAKNGTGNYTSIQNGVAAAKAGDTVYVKTGVYNEVVNITCNGISTAPVYILVYPGDSVKIDGQDVLGANWGHLVTVSGNYIHFEGFEVLNSAGMGVAVTGSHNELHRLNVHHNAENGILVTTTGTYNLVEGCHVWWNCKANEYGKRPSSWASGLSAARKPTYTTFRNNTINTNWGEGMSSYESSWTTMEDNIVYDNYSTNIYISDTWNVLCQRNLVYGTPNSVVTVGARVGIMLGDEKYNPSSTDITVINNIVIGTRRNFYHWKAAAAAPMQNVLIANNTFVNSTFLHCVQITAGDIVNEKFINNLVIQDDSLPVALVTTTPGFIHSNNLWSKTPPSNALGTGDVVGDPKIARTGNQFLPAWFRLLSSSPAIDKAITLTEVTDDYFKESRKATGTNSLPDIGADEFNKK